MLLLLRPKHWFAVVLFCGAAIAQDSVSVTVTRLATVQTFALGGVGYVGVFSKGASDFNYIMSQPEPVAVLAFEELYATGNSQGKAYALAGMKKLNYNRFREWLAETQSSSQEVKVMSGCMISRKALSKIAMQIDRKEFGFWLQPR